MQGLTRARAAEAVALAALTAIAVLVLALSWNRWLDPIVDVGRDLYVAEAVATGSSLYEDLRYNYPPLAPWILAAGVRLLGSTLPIFTAIGIATAAAALAALYALVRMTAGWLAAAAVALVFVCVHLAGTSTWGANFLYPYSHAATIGIAFYLLFAAALARHRFGPGGAASAWCAVGFGLLAAWSKIEYVPAVVLVMAVSVLVYRFPVRYVAALAGAGLGTFALAAVAFREAAPGHHWLRDNLLATPLLESTASTFFYASVSGRAGLAGRAGAAAAGAILVSAVVLLLAASGRARRGVGALALVASGAGCLLLARGSLFEVLPLIVIVLIPFGWREGAASPLAYLLAVALGTSIRIFFSLGPWWYGFVLVLPVYPLIAYVAAQWLPGRGIYPRKRAIVWLVLPTALAALGLANSFPAWRARSFEVPTRRGSYLDEPARGAAVRALLEWLDGRPAGETMVVLPEGIALNYFAKRSTPLSTYIFTPIEIDDPAIERRIIGEFETRRPDLVVIVPRDVREFGYRGFGVDYARGIASFLRRDYALAWRSGTRPEIAALERRR